MVNRRVFTPLVRGTLSLAVALSTTGRLRSQAPSGDWASLARYAQANAALQPAPPGEKRVVFMGNSITEGWARSFATLFPGKPYIGRGISGQTTPQMLVRFRQDVSALKPAVVVILGGTNDIAGNTGPSTLEMIEDNIASMTELARASGIASCSPPFFPRMSILGSRASIPRQRLW